MRIMIVTDAWRPQVNGVVRTLTETTRELSELGHTVEMITPLDFRTFPCPTYPDIRLSWRPYARVAATLKAFAPDAIHIATEGPLGLAARRWCMANQLRFTTAYHTRFPEYIHARVRLPLSASYAFMRWFHGPSAAVMAPTPSIKSALEGWGFNNVVVWSRGVNTDLFCPGERDRLDDSVPPRFVYIGRVAVEKNIEAFLQLDLPGSKWVVGDGPQMELLKRRYPNVWFAGVSTSRTGAFLPRGGCVCVPQPDRHLWPGAAGSHGLRHAGGGVSGGRAAGCGGRQRRWRAEPGFVPGLPGRHAHRPLPCAPPRRALQLGGGHPSV